MMEVMIRWPRLLPVNMLMIIAGIARMTPSTLDPHARITPSAWLKTLLIVLETAPQFLMSE